MKNRIMSLMFVFTLSFGFSQVAGALPSLSSIITNVKSLGSKACEKASLFSLKFSLRSFNGQLCNMPVVAKIAEALCSEAEGYQESQCHKNAVKALGKATPAEEKQAEEVVAEATE